MAILSIDSRDVLGDTRPRAWEFRPGLFAMAKPQHCVDSSHPACVHGAAV